MNTRKKKKRLGINHIDYDAGNVEHNIAMFNKMNNPTSAPSTNPVSGPMGESLKEGLINDEAKMYVLELVLSEYETGHTLVDDYTEFARLTEEDGVTADTDMWNLYIECHDLGPVGFYEEYKDVLDFSDEFKSKYAYEEEMDEEDFEIIEESLNEADDESVNDKIYQVRQIDDNGNELDQFLEFDSKEEAINKAKTISTPVEVKEMTKSMKESIGSDEKVIWTNLNKEEDLDEGMSREAIIDELKRVGKNYNFDRFSDSQIYRMYEKDVFLKPEAPKKPSRRSMMVNPYENTCEECGARLNDMGQCPRCVQGEEDLTEATLMEAPKWWEARKAKKAEEEAAKSDPAVAKARREKAAQDKVDEFIKKLGVILTPAYSDKCEDCRFLVNGKWYDQEGYERIADPTVISNLIKNKKILTSDAESDDIKTLCAAIDTTIVTPEGKIIRRGLENLSSKPITYIRGRTDLTDINPKMSSKIITNRLLPAIEKIQEEPKPVEKPIDDTTKEEPKQEAPKVEEPVVEKPAVDTPKEETPKAEEPKQEVPKEDTSTEEKPEDKTSETPTTAQETKPTTNWLNDNAVKYGVRALVGNRKDKRLLMKNETGHLTPIAPKDISLADIDNVFVDKDGKVSLRTALEKVKSEYRNKKADIIKKAAVFGESLNTKKGNRLTEAPIITLDDDDIYNPSEVSFKRKITQAQEREDALKREEAAEKERALYRKKYNKVIPILEDGLKNSKSSVDIIEELNSILVPARDECDTVGGEICRAMMRILYRWYNDGDRFYQGYGLETAGGSASYLASQIKSIEKLIDHLLQDYDYSYDNDDKYEQLIIEMTDNVIDYLRNNENVIFTPNVEDSRDWDTDYLEENQPKYEYELPSSDDIRTLVDNQILTAWDLNEYVDDWMNWNRAYAGASCSRPWSHYSDTVTVIDLTKDGLSELESTFRKNDRFSDEAVEEFWQELVDEHRDELESEDDYDDSYDEEEDYSTDIDVDDDV